MHKRIRREEKHVMKFLKETLEAPDVLSVTPDDIISFCDTIKLDIGDFSFKGREYLQDIVQDDSKIIAVLKGRQVGMTVTAAVLILYHALKYPNTTHIYASGTDAKLRYFSLDKLATIMLKSKISIKTGKTDARIKSYRLSNGSKIFLVSHHEGWKQARGISADFVYLDEIQDNADLTKLPNILETMAMSDFNRTWIFGTGSYEGSSWQKFYEKTDQKIWEGKWVPQKESTISGYHVPQYLMPNWNETLEKEKRQEYSASQYTMEVEGGFATGLSVPLPYSIAIKCFVPKPFCTGTTKPKGTIIASLDLAAGGEADTVLSISHVSDGTVTVIFAENYQDERAKILFDKIDSRLKEFQPDKIASDAGGNNELLYLLSQAYEVTPFRHTASKENITYRQGQAEITINKSFFTQRTISRFTEGTIFIHSTEPNWMVDHLTAETAETIHGTGSSIRFSKLPNRKDDFLQSLIFLEALLFSGTDENNPANKKFWFTG